MREAEVDPAEPTRAVDPGCQRDVVGPELEPGDLQDHVRDALPDLGRGAVDLGGPVLREHDAGRAVVVEALREADVLEADGEADAAPHALAARRVPRAAREADRVARQLLLLGKRERRRAPDHLGVGSDPVEHLAGRRACRPARARSAAAARRGRSRAPPRACPSAPRRRSRSARRRSRASPRRAGCSCRPPMPSMSTLSTRYGPTANEQAFEITAVELEAYAPPSSRIRMRTADEPAVARRAVLGPDPRRVPVHVADERLLAVVDHLHGPVRVQREQRGVDLHREVLAAAERAAHAGEVDPHLLRLEPEAGRDLVAVDVQPLRGDVDVDAALAVRDREPRLRARGRPGPAGRSRRRPRP